MLIRRLTIIPSFKHHQHQLLSSKLNKPIVTTLVSSSTLLNQNKSNLDQFNRTQIYTGPLTQFLRNATVPCLLLSSSPLLMAIYSHATLIQYTQQSYLLSFIAGIIPLAVLYQYKRVYITQIEHHSSTRITPTSLLTLTTEPMFTKSRYTECIVGDVKLIEKITTIINVNEKGFYLDREQCEALDEGGVFWRIVLEKYRIECDEKRRIDGNDYSSGSRSKEFDPSLSKEPIEYGSIAGIFGGFFAIGAAGIYYVMQDSDVSLVDFS